MKNSQQLLTQAWNTNMRLKYAVKWAEHHQIGKAQVVAFYRETCRKIGYSGSIKMPVAKKRRATRAEIIREFSFYIGGIFGPTYADWCGSSVNAELRKAGYAEEQSK